MNYLEKAVEASKAQTSDSLLDVNYILKKNKEIILKDIRLKDILALYSNVGLSGINSQEDGKNYNEIMKFIEEIIKTSENKEVRILNSFLKAYWERHEPRSNGPA